MAVTRINIEDIQSMKDVPVMREDLLTQLTGEKAMVEVTLKNGKKYYVEPERLQAAQVRGDERVRVTDTVEEAFDLEATTPGQEEEEKAETRRQEDIEEFTGVSPTTGFKNEEAVEAYLQTRGFDLEDPEVSALVDSIVATILYSDPTGEVLRKPEGQMRQVEFFVGVAKEKGLIRVSPYEATAATYGFDVGAEKREAFPYGPAGPAGGRAPQIDEVTGAIRYPKGVIVGPDPTGTPQVFFDEQDVSQPGSIAWLNSLSKMTSEEQQRQKELAVKYGYLPREALKHEGITNMDLYGTPTGMGSGGLRGLYTTYWSAGGEFRASGDDMAGAGPEKFHFPTFDFDQLKARAENEVVAIFAELYGARPKTDELKRFGELITNTAAEIYQKQEAVARAENAPMSHQEAYAEAVQTVQRDIAATPEVQDLQEAADRNTVFQDALARAAAAGDRLQAGR